MPIVRIEMLQGKSHSYKKTILNIVHQALVDAFKIPDYDRNQRIFELDKDNFEIPENRSDDYLLIEITAFQGRSYEAKKKLYQAIVDNLAHELGITRTDILIVLQEPPLENWGIAGGRPANEVNLSFKIDV